MEFITKVISELKDSINKLTNISGVDVSFDLDGDYIGLLVYVPFK